MFQDVTQNQGGTEGQHFEFYVPVTTFEKAGAEPGKQRRVAGIISTESRDLQGEVILQRGLDFDYFLEHGWLNDNHASGMGDVLGYPERVQTYAKGATLPDGSTAKTALTWMEGYLLHTKQADRVWELARALQGTNRRLGYSIEGQIQEREGPNDKTISRALVRNTALTHVPVNTDSRLDILMRSLQAAQMQQTQAGKSFSMGTATSVVSNKPYTGEGSGQLLAPESVEGDRRRKKKRKQDGMSKSEAVAWAMRHVPNLDEKTARQFVQITSAFVRSSIIDP